MRDPHLSLTLGSIECGFQSSFQLKTPGAVATVVATNLAIAYTHRSGRPWQSQQS